MVSKFAILSAAGCLLSANFAFAQTAPEFMVSWRALNFVPPEYQGKIFPINGTAIEAGFDLIDRGKIADLSKKEIRWFLDGTAIGNGIGKKTASFTVQKTANTVHNLRIEVADYNGTILRKNLAIPIK